MTQAQYDQWRANFSGHVTPSGDIQTAEGTTIGTMTSYDNRGEVAAGSMNFLAGLFASNYLRLIGPLAKLAITGRGITTLGVDSAAAISANAAEAAATETTNLTTQAASTIGNQGATASSKAVALQAAEEWVGPGARPIIDRTTGQVVGKISVDGSKVYRITSLNKPQPYVNLVNRATGGNLHVRF
ncbi:MAG: hypothetical protein JST77_00860 [Acidobacteria bacterium]|nr:hypothetical protein [Acidobacteriota bacterium]